MQCHGGILNVPKLLEEAYLLLATDQNGQIVPYDTCTDTNKDGKIFIKTG